ncbi:hypothetical protein [Flavivirga jejuensis]|uniref:VRR-NUC domain-containing protein n=1 Tax=Flavivirga jejuensis TaxID=870487 RepID=A0ABT8WK41_9FLAO|nr:hypothetical protein [Flavivirga jejuensis]MDO5973530.1 hypothetical protein [Flavivirga jejuensis]
MAIKKLIELRLEKLKADHPTVPEYAIPKPKYSDRTSNGLTKCIIDLIELNGFQAERINSMGKQLDNRKTVTDVIGRQRTVGSVTWIKGSGQVGTADISSTIMGRSIKIEIKCKSTNDNRQSKAQKDYQKKIERAGGVYIIVRTFQDFYNWFNEFNNKF